MKKPEQIEIGTWRYEGCIILQREHPKLMGKYEVFRDNETEDHIGAAYTFKEAKEICKQTNKQII